MQMQQLEGPQSPTNCCCFVAVLGFQLLAVLGFQLLLRGHVVEMIRVAAFAWWFGSCVSLWRTTRFAYGYLRLRCPRSSKLKAHVFWVFCFHTLLRWINYLRIIWNNLKALVFCVHTCCYGSKFYHFKFTLQWPYMVRNVSPTRMSPILNS